MATQIELQVAGTSGRLRRFTDELQAALGNDGAVSGWLGTADPDDEPKSGTVYVEVFQADDDATALEVVQPAVRLADPDLSVVTGGTSAMRLYVPPPPEADPPN